MWKNIFLESCLLSALIFGGLYLNANSLKEELYENSEKASIHISGVATSVMHISGEKLEEGFNISGAFSPMDK
jgi:hypothetical protein